MKGNLKERESLVDLGENVKLLYVILYVILYVTRKSSHFNHELILQINVSSNGVSPHHIHYKSIQKKANVYSCTGGYKCLQLH